MNTEAGEIGSSMVGRSEGLIEMAKYMDLARGFTLEYGTLRHGRC